MLVNESLNNSASWTEGRQTEGRTDGWTDSPCVLLDFIPLRGRCPAPPQPKSHASQAGRGHRWPLTAFGMLFFLRWSLKTIRKYFWSLKTIRKYFFISNVRPNSHNHRVREASCCNKEDVNLPHGIKESNCCSTSPRHLPHSLASLSKSFVVCFPSFYDSLILILPLHHLFSSHRLSYNVFLRFLFCTYSFHIISFFSLIFWKCHLAFGIEGSAPIYFFLNYHIFCYYISSY